MTIKRVAEIMEKKSGVPIKVECVKKLPSDYEEGSSGYMGLVWDTYAARSGEYVVLANVFSEGRVFVQIV